MVERQPSKLVTRVRFPSPAPFFCLCCRAAAVQKTAAFFARRFRRPGPAFSCAPHPSAARGALSFLFFCAARCSASRFRLRRFSPEAPRSRFIFAGGNGSRAAPSAGKHSPPFSFARPPLPACLPHRKNFPPARFLSCAEPFAPYNREKDREKGAVYVTPFYFRTGRHGKDRPVLRRHRPLHDGRPRPGPAGVLPRAGSGHVPRGVHAGRRVSRRRICGRHGVRVRPPVIPRFSGAPRRSRRSAVAAHAAAHPAPSPHGARPGPFHAPRSGSAAAFRLVPRVILSSARRVSGRGV